MSIKNFKPYTPSRRAMTTLSFDEITKTTPEKSLLVTLKHIKEDWWKKPTRCYYHSSYWWRKQKKIQNY